MSIFERSKFGSGRAGYRTREALAASILLWCSYAGGPRLAVQGAPLLGGEMVPVRTPKDSVWWVPASGAPVKLADDLSRLKKRIRRDLKAAGLDSPSAQLSRKRWARAGVVAAVVVAATVAVVLTAGAASPAVGAGAAAAGGGSGAATAGGGGTLAALGLVSSAASNAKDTGKRGKSGRSIAEIAQSIGQGAGSVESAYNAVQAAIPAEYIQAGEQTAATQAEQAQAEPVPLLSIALGAGGGLLLGGPVGAAIGGALGWAAPSILDSE